MGLCICGQRHSNGRCCTHPRLLRLQLVVVTIDTLRGVVVCGAARSTLDTTSAQRPSGLSVKERQATTAASPPRKTWRMSLSRREAVL